MIIRNNYLSWPAVSHIVSFNFFFWRLIYFILKSTPIVLPTSSVKFEPVNLKRIEDFPTPLLPINNILNKWSYFSFPFTFTLITSEKLFFFKFKRINQSKFFKYFIEKVQFFWLMIPTASTIVAYDLYIEMNRNPSSI